MPGFDNFTSFGSEAIQRFKKDAARAFGVPFESAFDKLPQPRPKKPDEENKR